MTIKEAKEHLKKMAPDEKEWPDDFDREAVALAEIINDLDGTFIIPPLALEHFDSLGEVTYWLTDIYNQSLSEKQELALAWVLEFLAQNEDKIKDTI